MNQFPQTVFFLAALSCVLLSCAPGTQSSATPTPTPSSSSSPAMPVSTPGMPQFAPPALVNEASQITQRFMSTLLPTLQTAMSEGGPLNAIDVCAVQAPEIARQLSVETGWDVSRVSLKARNSALATPDTWERQVLMTFDQKQRMGELGASLNVAETVNGQFRYMQAQPTAPLCLACHGSEVSAQVISAIRSKYPNDLALGYQVGQIRGAISLLKDLD